MNENFTQHERKLIRDIFERLGETDAIKFFGVSTESLLRVLADLSVRKGTAMVIRAALSKTVPQSRKYRCD